MKNSKKNLKDKKGVSCSSLKSFDIFGEPIHFTLNKERHFKTTWGTIVSTVCIVLLTMFFVMRTIKLFSKEDPFFSMTTLENAPETLDLWSLGFSFAVESIDPRVGRVSATLNTWNDDLTNKVENPLELVDCKKVSESG